jgi:carbonic anhydrase
LKPSGDATLVIQQLLEGNQRFLAGTSVQEPGASLKKLEEFARDGQDPKAIVLCCSDSRAPVEMIFDQDIGDLFVIRVAGNIVAPSLVGSVEFGISTFGTELVLVMGHTHCGAVTATLDHIEHAGSISSENIHDIVSRIKPHIFEISQISELSHDEKMTRAVEANVRASVGQLSHSSRMIEEMVQQKKVTIIGAVLDIATGAVTLLDSTPLDLEQFPSLGSFGVDELLGALNVKRAKTA